MKALADFRSRAGYNRDSGGSRKWSEKFGTLKDFDILIRFHGGNGETEDDPHGDLN